MLGDVMVQELAHSITNEEVRPGPLPDWLLNHIRWQSTDPLPPSEGGPSRILILYPGAVSYTHLTLPTTLTV